MKIRRFFAVLLVLAALMTVTGCAAQMAPAEGQDQYFTDPVPEGKPKPVDDAAVGTEQGTCVISISCATLVDDLDKLKAEKRELVPEDGWLLPEMEVSFTQGESVFDVLKRVCREEKIHMEFSTTPLYHSAYIEGIGNLYEYDAGELSGWMYSVNDWFPNYGCSRYQVKQGDVIRWQFSCDLGKDVGGSNAAGTMEK